MKETPTHRRPAGQSRSLVAAPRDIDGRRLHPPPGQTQHGNDVRFQPRNSHRISIPENARVPSAAVTRSTSSAARGSLPTPAEQGSVPIGHTTPGADQSHPSGNSTVPAGDSRNKVDANLLPQFENGAPASPRSGGRVNPNVYAGRRFLKRTGHQWHLRRDFCDDERLSPSWSLSRSHE